MPCRLGPAPSSIAWTRQLCANLLPGAFLSTACLPLQQLIPHVTASASALTVSQPSAHDMQPPFCISSPLTYCLLQSLGSHPALHKASAPRLPHTVLPLCLLDVQLLLPLIAHAILSQARPPATASSQVHLARLIWQLLVLRAVLHLSQPPSTQCSPAIAAAHPAYCPASASAPASSLHRH